MRIRKERDRTIDAAPRPRALLGSRPFCVAGTIVTLGLGLGACGSSDPTAILNTAKIERAIANSSLAQRGLHAEVSCPSNVQQKKGLEFTCTASVGHVDTEFVVVQLDSAGHVHYEAP
jgi:hypothetical protein